jgi:hypothetical protein
MALVNPKLSLSLNVTDNKKNYKPVHHTNENPLYSFAQIPLQLMRIDFFNIDYLTQLEIPCIASLIACF